MNIVVFGLTMSSSWGNGHATLWRGLVGALRRRGHAVTFFERDVPYYASTRDYEPVHGETLVLYPDWASVSADAFRAVANADVALITSYCPDAAEAERLVLDVCRGRRVFYDLDTPVTLASLDEGARPAYVGARGFADYDLVLSYTGGRALGALRDRLGAKRVAPLYGHVDPTVHRPVPPDDGPRSALTYLGTYAPDRQPALEALFVEPARQRPALRFTIGGAQYPQDFPWTQNIFFLRHLPPPDHPRFFCSGHMTLNVTRAAMAAMGWCPSGRLFEAAACGTAILTDSWEGLDAFFTPGEDILVADTTAGALAALDLSDAAVARIARAARDRVMSAHSSDHRALDFEAALAAAPVEA